LVNFIYYLLGQFSQTHVSKFDMTCGDKHKLLIFPSYFFHLSYSFSFLSSGFLYFKLFYFNRDVQYSASSQKVTELLCGSPQDGCSPEAFVKFIGNNNESPFSINVYIADEPFLYNSTQLITPTNTTTVLCNQNINLPHFKALACSCSDCTDACPVPIPPPVVEVCKLGELACLDVVFIILFCVSSLSFLGILLLSKIFKNYTQKKEKNSNYISFFF